jgi:hypothetical protein
VELDSIRGAGYLAAGLSEIFPIPGGRPTVTNLSSRGTAWLLLSLAVPAAAGCAGGSGGSTALPELPRYLFTLDVQRPEDRRDFNQLQLAAPELMSVFDRYTDAYGLDSGYRPFVVEYTSGGRFEWPDDVRQMVWDALIFELKGSDMFRWVEADPPHERPTHVLHTNIAEFHLLRQSHVLYPQVTLEALVLDGVTGDVLFKTRSRISDEYGISVEGTMTDHTLQVEEWVDQEFREQFRRALERCVEKLYDRLHEDYFYPLAEAEKVKTAKPHP